MFSENSTRSYVVVDVETTGLTAKDRIVEVAAVVVDEKGRVKDEWDTLVNPERSVGASHIHGITDDMVQTAPTFEEIGAALAEKLEGRILVAHNLPFEERFLIREYQKAGGKANLGRGVDTLELTGQKLEQACEKLGIRYRDKHRALADAHATAELLSRIIAHVRRIDVKPVTISHNLTYSLRTHRREATRGRKGAEAAGLVRTILGLAHDGHKSHEVAYLEQLDLALADQVLSAKEKLQMRMVARQYGLDDEAIHELHIRYMDELVRAAVRDGIVTAEEEQQLVRVAEALGVDNPLERVDVAEARYQRPDIPQDGVVVFTGGSAEERAKLEQLARDCGYQVEDTLTKKRTRLLVAQSLAVNTAKLRNAQKWGIPTVTFEDFAEEMKRRRREERKGLFGAAKEKLWKRPA